MTEWISVNDRLPDEKPIMIASTMHEKSSDFVLVYVDNITWPYPRKIIATGRYDYSRGSWVVRNAFRGHVTHWMPLPEPPKEGNDD